MHRIIFNLVYMVSTAPHAFSFDVVLLQAIAHHRAGRLQETEQLYRSVLQASPDQPDANHNPGVLACQVGQAKGASPIADHLNMRVSRRLRSFLFMDSQWSF